MSLAAARAVADAVLYEGYLLYPYRASSSKNLLRWQFGVVGPPGAAESGDGEESSMLTECLLEMSGSGTAEIDVQARFLQVRFGRWNGRFEPHRHPLAVGWRSSPSTS